MERFRRWLIRQRDRTLVSYSRFGKPGDEEDDRPPPTSITVAPFDENAAEFLFLRYWHVQRAAVTFAGFGIGMVIVFFLSSFFEFDWYHHEHGVDVGALLGLFTYLTLGVLIHYYVIFGVRKQLAYYLLPFIIVYSLLCTCEAILCLALIYKMVEHDPTMPHLVHTTALTSASMPSSLSPVSSSTTTIQIFPPLGSIFFVTFVSVVVQTIMLAAVVKCRRFISLKVDHDMELKVAEKSRTKNPSMQIVVAGDSNGTTAINGSTVNGTPVTSNAVNGTADVPII